MIRLSFAELRSLRVRVCLPLQHVDSAPNWVRYAGLFTEPCWRRRFFEANPVVGDEARKGFPPTAIWGTTASAGSTLLKKASHTYRLHCRMQCVFWRVGSGLQPPIYSVSADRLEGSSFQILQGPSRRIRRKSSFSILVVKFWNRLPISIATSPSINSFKRQLDSAWKDLFSEVPWFPISLTPPSPNSAIPFYIIPSYAIPTPNHCHALLY